MRAGVSYSDWRQMTQWQRNSLVLGSQHRNLVFAQKLKNAENFAESLGLIVGRMLGLD